MIALLIIYLVLNSSSSDKSTLDDLIRQGYTPNSIEEFKEAEKILDRAMVNYPESHIGLMARVMAMTKQGNSKDANELLAEFNKCDLDLGLCDSPAMHIAAKILQAKAARSESMFIESETILKELLNDLQKKIYLAKIDIGSKIYDLEGACRACNGYYDILDGGIPSDVAFKCFVIEYSRFGNPERYWRFLAPKDKDAIRRHYGHIEF